MNYPQFRRDIVRSLLGKAESKALRPVPCRNPVNSLLFAGVVHVCVQAKNKVDANTAYRTPE